MENFKDILLSDAKIDEKRKFLLLHLLKEIDNIDSEVLSITYKIANNKDFKYSLHRAKIEYVREKIRIIELMDKIFKEIKDEENNINDIENISEIFGKK